MAHDPELRDALSDAEAYFDAGHAGAAVDVLFEALDARGSQSPGVEHVYAMLGGISCTLSARREFQQAADMTRRILNEVISRSGSTIDPEFLDIYATACVATGSNPFPVQRLFRHQNLLEVFRGIPESVSGAVAECGCARGLSFMELCLEYGRRHPGWMGEEFHIFDSFMGLSEPTDKDRGVLPGANEDNVGKNMVAGHYAFSLELVTENVHRHFPRVQLHPGWIPASFQGLAERQYRFVHVDVDLYQPTIGSLVYFYPRLAPGGVIISDDYNWPGAKLAFHEYCDAGGLELHTTGTMQAYLLKH